MGNYYLVSTEDELYHHGVKGMKWGQHIFGKKARTARKRKRVLKKARVEKAKQKKISEQRRKDFEAGKIKPKDMTIEELYEYKAKLALQKDVYDLKSQNAAKTVKAGRRVVGDLASKGLKAGIEEGVKNGTADLVKRLLIRAGDRAFGFDKGNNSGNQNGQQKPKTDSDGRTTDNDPPLKKIKFGKKESRSNSGAGKIFSEFARDTVKDYKKSGASYDDVVDAFREPVQAVRRAADPAVNAVRNSDTVQLGSRYIAGLLEAPKDYD